MKNTPRFRLVSQSGLILVLWLWMAKALPGGPDYALTAQPVARDTYVFVGSNEHFTLRNGGNIVNTGVIVTNSGVVVVDTGPSRLYGEQMREAITKLTDQPVVLVVNTHLHPDHFLGNQAFHDVGVAALPATGAAIRAHGEGFTDNMYRLVDAWMRGTEAAPPTEAIAPGLRTLGDHRLEFIALSGHSGSDLAVLDHTTGVLFAGDLVFHDRAPTTPHADLETWLSALDRLQTLDFETLVPGHGPVAQGHRPIEQTRAYLTWLDGALRRGAETGLAMAEVLQTKIPAPLAELAVLPEEFHRSTSHLYPELERASLPALPTER